jgi:hypothetical protein
MKFIKPTIKASSISVINVINVINEYWRRWAAVLIGVGLFASIWVLGASGGQASLINAWAVGFLLMLGAGILPVLYGRQTTALAGGLLGAWLLISPFVLGFAGSAAAWVAWLAGPLTLAVSVTPEPVFDLMAWMQRWRRAWRVRRGLRRVSPQHVTRYEEREQDLCPEELGQRLVERTYQIHRTLSSQPSQTEVEMCVLGYQACMDDLITLVHQVNEEQPEASGVRRLRLGLARRRGIHALSRVREKLPSQAPCLQRQSEV